MPGRRPTIVTHHSHQRTAADSSLEPTEYFTTEDPAVAKPESFNDAITTNNSRRTRSRHGSDSEEEDSWKESVTSREAGGRGCSGAESRPSLVVSANVMHTVHVLSREPPAFKVLITPIKGRSPPTRASRMTAPFTPPFTPPCTPVLKRAYLKRR